MNTKFVSILFMLILATTVAFAASAITSTIPAANEIIYGGRNYVLDFNVITEDSNGDLAVPVTQLGIYYSETAGQRSYLIYQDVNLFDGTGIICADYNFVNITDCNYTWSVPETPNLPVGRYYFDYNLSQANYAAGGRTNNTFSSNIFEIQQPMSSTMVAMIALALFIVAAGLAIFAVLGMGNGMDLRTFLQMAIVVALLIIIAWTLYGVVLVP